MPHKEFISDGQRMLRLNRDVVLVELPGGEHLRTTDPNERIKLKAAEDFLAEHMGAQNRDR